MLIEVKVPQLSESVAEATLISWHKQQGDRINRGENLVDIETDKVVLELPAPKGGVLAEIIKNDGATVTSGEVIAKIETESRETEERSKTEAAATDESDARTAAADEGELASEVEEERVIPKLLPL